MPPASREERRAETHRIAQVGSSWGWIPWEIVLEFPRILLLAFELSRKLAQGLGNAKETNKQTNNNNNNSNDSQKFDSSAAKLQLYGHPGLLSSRILGRVPCFSPFENFGTGHNIRLDTFCKFQMIVQYVFPRCPRDLVQPSNYSTMLPAMLA